MTCTTPPPSTPTNLCLWGVVHQFGRRKRSLPGAAAPIPAPPGGGHPRCTRHPWWWPIRIGVDHWRYVCVMWYMVWGMGCDKRPPGGGHAAPCAGIVNGGDGGLPARWGRCCAFAGVGCCAPCFTMLMLGARGGHLWWLRGWHARGSAHHLWDVRHAATWNARSCWKLHLCRLIGCFSAVGSGRHASVCCCLGCVVCGDLRGGIWLWFGQIHYECSMLGNEIRHIVANWSCLQRFWVWKMRVLLL